MTSSDNPERHFTPSRRAFFGGLGVGLSVSTIAAGTARAQGAKHGPEKPAAEPSEGGKPKELSPEEKMARRFPQPVKISYLLGLPMIDERNETLGHVRQVVRSGAGKIRLVIDYGGLFGIGSRLVAVPVEVCAMLGRQVAAADMPRDAFEPAPTWFGSGDEALKADEIIRVAVMRR
ncbi:PRC-barrel domain-containing protein [Bosea sp. PAMC 26642]|uniref:PRC-barrel domain-containing protein n=1 Tax=Bosea sp. (strain PAMC 26642) TaxID=1792307 RepID=UPI0007706920|nr:PRC-barrel domain-containing protein [Bosea sp. PAMC 26642]AMJ59620.1 hypothetical protein AXW83_04255 [Bosea sp. PAMC 26642]